MAGTESEGDAAQDPYEMNWPDDTRAFRAAEREAEAKRALVRPASVYLAAPALGIGIVLLFVLPISLVSGTINLFIAVASPVIIGGLVLAYPPAILLERVSRGWRRGLPELAFIALGIAIGAGWTWVFLTAFQASLFDDPVQMAAIRAPSSVFMATAVASAFTGARAFVTAFSRARTAVYAAAGLIALLALVSGYANIAL